MSWILAHWKMLAGAALSLGLIVGAAKLYRDGREAGKATVRTEVQTKTIETLTNAQERKDQVDHDVSKTPYKDAVDQLD